MRFLKSCGFAAPAVWGTALVAGIPCLSPNGAEGGHALFRSEDLGRSWVRIDAGLGQAGRINGLAASQTHHFAATDAGVYRSEVRGENWAPVGRLPREAERALCVGVRGATILAGTAGGGLLRSVGPGAVWHRVDGTQGRATVRALAQSEDQLFAGLDAGGVLRSEDDGEQWMVLSDGLPERAQVFDLAVMGRELFAALYSQGVYRLRLGEEHPRWVRAGEALPLALAATGTHVAAGHNPGGIFWSDDQGRTWKPSQGEYPISAPVWAMAGSGDVLLAGAADGIFRSDDLGKTWVRSERGLVPASSGIAFHIREREILAAVALGRWRGE